MDEQPSVTERAKAYGLTRDRLLAAKRGTYGRPVLISQYAQGFRRLFPPTRIEEWEYRGQGYSSYFSGERHIYEYTRRKIASRIRAIRRAFANRRHEDDAKWLLAWARFRGLFRIRHATLARFGVLTEEQIEASNPRRNAIRAVCRAMDVDPADAVV